VTRRPSARGTLLLTAIVAAGVAFWAVVLVIPVTSSSEAGDAGVPPVFADTQRFLREEVTLTGQVEQRYRKGAFALAVDGGHEAVVLPAEGEDADVPRGRVTVTGSVRRVGLDLRHLLGGDTSVRRGAPALAEATVVPAGGS
jgi:hypothetical protein